ncbi:MAG: hypothetical protein ABW189_08070 [Rickettsiales bacterium]
MGGLGSGNRYRDGSAKDTVENRRCLNLSLMRREGAVPLCGRHSGGWQWTDGAAAGKPVSSLSYEADTSAENGPYLRLFYTLTRTGERYDYRIPLAVTFPHFGGKRFLFLCLGCGRRTPKLYLHPPQGIYLCRRCNGLNYESQHESPAFRAVIRRLRRGGDKPFSY